MDILTIRGPDRTAFAVANVERIIGSMRRDCLDHVIIFNEAHLRRVLSCHFRYYHRSRTHLSLNKDCPDPRSIQPPSAGKIVAFPRSVDSIIGTSVARLEPQRSSIRAVASARSLPFESLRRAALSRPPVKIAALDFADRGDRIPRTDKFPSMADRRGRG